MSGAFPGRNLYIVRSETEPNDSTIWYEPKSNGILPWEKINDKWYSLQTYQREINLVGGQGMLIGGIVGLVSGDTTDTQFIANNEYNLFLIKLAFSFSVGGNLSASNYWRLQFKSSANVVQTLNATSGDNGEVTGFVRKTSNLINTEHAHNGRYSLSLRKIGSAPNASNPTASVEYRLIRG